MRLLLLMLSSDGWRFNRLIAKRRSYSQNKRDSRVFDKKKLEMPFVSVYNR
jgi:hypothetical protein